MPETPGTDSHAKSSGLSWGSFFSGAGTALITLIGGWIIAGPGGGDSTETVTETVAGRTQTINRTVTKIVQAGDETPCAGSRVTNDPPYEPNNLASEAYGPLRSGQPLNGSLDFEDVDFYALCVAGEARIRVQVRKTGCKSNNTCYGAELQLVDDNGRVLTSSKVDPDSTVGTLTRRVGRGRYFVRIFDGTDLRYDLAATSSGSPLARVLPR